MNVLGDQAGGLVGVAGMDGREEDPNFDLETFLA